MRALLGNSRPATPVARIEFLIRLCLAALIAPLASVAAANPHPPAVRGLLLDAALNGHAVVAVGERGAIARSVDSGESWEAIASPTHATLTGIAFANPENGWAVGHEGVILQTRDGGETWTEQFHTDDPEVVFLDVAAIDATRAVVIGAFGIFYTTRDSGRTWQRQDVLEQDNHLNRITQAADDGFYIAGERGTLLRLPGFGKPVEPLASPHEVSFYGITPVSNGSLLAYGLRGHIYRSQDEGATWQRIQSPLQALFSTALQLKSGTIVVAGQSRAFLVSRDGGATFSIWQPPLTMAVAELLEAPNGLLLAFGDGGVIRLEPPGPPAGATKE